MATAHQLRIREELLDRRQRLEVVLPIVKERDPLRRLLKEVDAALERIEEGRFGICETCHDPVEPERLEADPLLCYCLDHLTPKQQHALQQDLDLTSRIQADLLPRREARFDGWAAVYHYEPLGPVSGDYCDLVPAPDGSTFFAMGDVSGKGVAASMLMAHLHALFRSLVPLGLPIQDLVARANRVFAESTSGGRYATLACGLLRPDGVAEIVNAGHTPPLVVAGGATRSVTATGIPIGLFCEPEHTAETVRLAAGDSLVLVTDGVTESRDRAGAEYGLARLARAAERCAGLAPEALLAGCVEDVATFRAGTPRNDDLTVLVVRRQR